MEYIFGQHPPRRCPLLLRLIERSCSVLTRVRLRACTTAKGERRRVGNVARDPRERSRQPEADHVRTRWHGRSPCRTNRNDRSSSSPANRCPAGIPQRLGPRSGPGPRGRVRSSGRATSRRASRSSRSSLSLARRAARLAPARFCSELSAARSAAARSRPAAARLRPALSAAAVPSRTARTADGRVCRSICARWTYGFRRSDSRRLTPADWDSQTPTFGRLSSAFLSCPSSAL